MAATSTTRATGRKPKAPLSYGVFPPDPFASQVERIGGALGVAAVKNALREADRGVMAPLANLGHDARQKDCTLQQCLHARETALTIRGWTVAPYVAPGAKGATPEDQAISDFCLEALEQATGVDEWAKSFDDCITHLSSASYFGYAVSEIVPKSFGDKIWPIGFINHPHRRFSFDPDTLGILWFDRNSHVTPYPGVDFQREWPGRFIVHQPRINGDSPNREGLIRPLVWTALFRNWDVRDWLQLAELAWKPWRKGGYAKGTSKEHIAGLIRSLREMSSSGVIVHNRDESDIEFAFPGQGGSRSSHRELADWLGSEMAKAIRGGTLTSEAGERGARSLGEVHERGEKAIVEYDAIVSALTLRRSLLRALVQWNFGADKNIPLFSFLTDDGVALLEFSEGVVALAKSGLRIPAKWVRDQVGIPEPEETDELLGAGSDDEDDADEDDAEPDDDGEPEEEAPEEDPPAD